MEADPLNPVGESAAPPPDEHGEMALVLRRSSNTIANAAKATPRRRELMLAGAGALLTAVVTFVLMSSRGGSSATLVATPSATATRVENPPAAFAGATSAVQKWSGENRKFWLGSGRGAAFELTAENSVQTWFGLVQPTLVVRCESRTIETFVFTRSPVKIEPNVDGRTVTVSVDEEPVRKERWSTAEDRPALFAPDGAAFAERLMHARTLRFGFSPHNSNDVVAQFSVAGLAELMEPVARECGRRK
jgi:hypothetical protein